MAYSLTTFVHVTEPPGPNSQGRTGTFGPGQVLPVWALAAITNPDVWADGRVPAHITGAVADGPSAAGVPTTPAPPGPQALGEGATATLPPGPPALDPDPDLDPELEPQPGSEVKRPTSRAAKDEWVRYVLATTDRTEAELEGLTKAELIELADQAAE